jgi:GT2 family glycosyltransferase
VDVTVIVGTFGDYRWSRLAYKRAIPSADAEGVPVVHVHGETLADARNRALELADTEWVCHLDADDELEPGYFAAMARAAGDLRAPVVRYVWGHSAPPASLPPFPYDRGDLTDGNWLVIGTCVRAELVRKVGGWREWAFYEDWDLWQRCWLAGATIEAVPDAVYRAHARTSSRNRSRSRDEKTAMHHAIRRANLPWLYDDEERRP